jgi:hypothetical protein
MSNPKTVYLVSACQGHVLAHAEKGRSGVVAENRGCQGDEEKWVVEQGDEPDVVAFRCAANGKYLNAEPGRYNYAGTGDRQWWKISFEEVRTPAGWPPTNPRLVGWIGLDPFDNPIQRL